MKQIIVYVVREGRTNIIKCNSLREGHDTFNQEFLNGFDYLELGIDKIDIDGTYKIVRKCNRK